MDILPEETGGHLANAAMVVSFARHFVAPFRNFSDQFGSRIRHPPEDKKCGPDAELIEHVQGPASTDFEALLEAVP